MTSKPRMKPSEIAGWVLLGEFLPGLGINLGMVLALLLNAIVLWAALNDKI